MQECFSSIKSDLTQKTTKNLVEAPTHFWEVPTQASLEPSGQCFSSPPCHVTQVRGTLEVSWGFQK